MEDRWSEIPDYFDTASGLTGGEREAYLERVCGDDWQLRAQLDELLVAADFSDEESDLAEGKATALRIVEGLDRELTPNVPGYELTERIGRGGMGTVYRARHLQSGRAVAIKTLHRPMDQPELRRRFEFESGLLKQLDHPGVAKIYETGTFDTDFGPQPYCAMELVDGANIVDYRSTHDLGDEEILALLASVCDAVHHAHQKGIVHRDLKPGNIMIAADGQPRVVDFGLARATNSDLTTIDAMTRTGQILGTVGYMSPEQASGRAQDVDVRSDVYALGVVGYELLAGRLPHAIDGVALPDALRSIIEDDAPGLASTDRRFRGDLDTIFGVALDRDPDRRFSSAAEFGAEIRRHLEHRPILARPLDRTERIRRYLYRNRAALSVATIIFTLLVLGLIGTSHGRWLANERWLEAEAAREREAARALEAERSMEIVREIFHSVEGRGRNARVIDILESTRAEIFDGLEETPRTEGRLRHLLGVAYAALGEYENARVHLERAEELLGETGERTLYFTAAADHATVLSHQGQLTEAIDRLERILERRIDELGSTHADVVRLRVRLGAALRQAGEWDRAKIELQRARSRAESVHGSSHPETLGILHEIGQLHVARGAHREARPIFREVVERASGNEDRSARRQVRASRLALAQCLLSEGQHAEARSELHDVVPRIEAELGVSHPTAVVARAAMGWATAYMGNYDDAETIFLATTEALSEQLGPNHEATLSSRAGLAYCWGQSGRVEDALQLRREIYFSLVESYGESHPSCIRAKIELGGALLEVGQAAAAESHLERGLAAAMESFALEDAFIATAALQLSEIQAQSWKLESAVEVCRQALARVQPRLSPEHPSVRALMGHLASLYSRGGRQLDAIALQEELLRSMQREPGPDHQSTLQLQVRLALACGRQGDPERSIVLCEDALERCEGVMPPDHPFRSEIQATLAVGLRDVRRTEEAEQHFREVLRREDRRDQGPALMGTMFRREWVTLLRREGRHQEAVDEQGKVLDAFTRVLGSGHPQALWERAHWIALRGRAGETESLVREYSSVVDDLIEATGPEHDLALVAQRVLIEILTVHGDPRRAEALGRRLTEVWTQRARLGPATNAAEELRLVQGALAQVLVLLGEFEEALTLVSPQDPTLRHQVTRAEALLGARRFAEAEVMFGRCRESGVDDRSRLRSRWIAGVLELTDSWGRPAVPAPREELPVSSGPEAEDRR